MSIFEKIKNEVDLEKKLVLEEVITAVNEENMFRGFTRVDVDKQIHNDVHKYIHATCASCGLVEWLRFDEDKMVLTYELKLIENNWPTDSFNDSTFKKLVLDAIAEKKKIFNITDKQLFINKPDNMFPILTLKYESFEAMLRDLITATNYINEELEKNNN